VIQKIDKRQFLEYAFEGEEGVGLGPTLEFYDNIAEEFKTWKIEIADSKSQATKEFTMWRTTKEGWLFPSPLCIKSFDQAKIKQVYEMFRLCGTIIAKAIVDDRMIDLPISPLFWKLCLGSQMSIFDYKDLDTTEGQNIFKMLAEFQILSSQAETIQKESITKNLTEEQTQKMLA